MPSMRAFCAADQVAPRSYVWKGGNFASAVVPGDRSNRRNRSGQRASDSPMKEPIPRVSVNQTSSGHRPATLGTIRGSSRNTASTMGFRPGSSNCKDSRARGLRLVKTLVASRTCRTSSAGGCAAIRKPPNRPRIPPASEASVARARPGHDGKLKSKTPIVLQLREPPLSGGPFKIPSALYIVGAHPARQAI